MAGADLSLKRLLILLDGLSMEDFVQLQFELAAKAQEMNDYNDRARTPDEIHNREVEVISNLELPELKEIVQFMDVLTKDIVKKLKENSEGKTDFGADDLALAFTEWVEERVEAENVLIQPLHRVHMNVLADIFQKNNFPASSAGLLKIYVGLTGANTLDPEREEVEAVQKNADEIVKMSSALTQEWKPWLEAIRQLKLACADYKRKLSERCREI